MVDMTAPTHALEQLGSVWPVALPMVFSAIAASIPVVQWWVQRADKSVDRTMTREQRLMAETDARIAQASKIDADVMTRLQAELGRVTGRMADLERERDKSETERDSAWDRARYWHRRAHDMRHIATMMTTMVTDEARASGREIPATPDLSLPNFQVDPLPA